jgi:hypothetical protein
MPPRIELNQSLDECRRAKILVLRGPEEGLDLPVALLQAGSMSERLSSGLGISLVSTEPNPTWAELQV